MFCWDDVLGQLARPVSGADREALARGLRQLAVLRAALAGCEARLLGAFEAAGGPASEGAVDAAGWLRAATGVSAREATQRVVLARAVEMVPAVGSGLDAGVVGPEQAVTIARVLARTPRVGVHAESLVGAAQVMAADVFAKHARAVELRAGEDGWDATLAYTRRRLRTHPDEDGTTVVHARLTVEAAAEVMGVVDSIAEELWRADHPAAPAGTTGGRDSDLGQRRADALVEMARRARTVSPGGGRRDTARVMVLVDHDTLRGDLHDSGICTLDDGTPIPAATARRLACTARIYPWVLGGPSGVLDHGRARRFASPAQWDALIVRDGGCVVGDCQRPWQWCDAHHLQDWDERLGPTDLENLALVCEHHHHLVHDQNWTLQRTPDGGYQCRSPNGHLTLTRPPRRSPPRTRPLTTPQAQPRARPCPELWDGSRAGAAVGKEARG